MESQSVILGCSIILLSISHFPLHERLCDLDLSGAGFSDLGDGSMTDALTLGLGQSEYDRRKKKK